MDGIEYVGIVVIGSTVTHKFHMLADGNRPVLDVYVADMINQEKMPILINRHGAPFADTLKTLGETHADVQLTVVDGQEGLTRTMCEACIVTYIVPRTATMMARVYLPQPMNVE